MLPAALRPARRVESARRRAGEQRAALRVVEAVDQPHGDGSETGEFGPIVQEEVRRLPEKYRAVVVLCYWQGMTHEQAAIQLGCPLGTVRSRMARARKLLHKRLSRRGAGPLAGISAAGMGSVSIPESPAILQLTPVPPELVRATVRAASQVAGGNALGQAVSSLAATLVEHVLWSTTMFKIKSAVAGMALLGLTGSGVWFSGLRGQAVPVQVKSDQKAGVPAEKAKPADRIGVKSMADGNTTIMKIVADGSTVKKGQVVCELDFGRLPDLLTNQQIATQAARASYENAKLAREVAEIDATAYEQGTYLMELHEAEGDIHIAEAELSLADDELKAAKTRAPQLGNNELDIKRAELAALRQVRGRKDPGPAQGAG